MENKTTRWYTQIRTFKLVGIGGSTIFIPGIEQSDAQEVGTVAPAAIHATEKCKWGGACAFCATAEEECFDAARVPQTLDGSRSLLPTCTPEAASMWA